MDYKLVFNFFHDNSNYYLQVLRWLSNGSYVLVRHGPHNFGPFVACPVLLTTHH